MRIECHECEHHECFDCPVTIESEVQFYAIGGRLPIECIEQKGVDYGHSENNKIILAIGMGKEWKKE